MSSISDIHTELASPPESFDEVDEEHYPSPVSGVSACHTLSDERIATMVPQHRQYSFEASLPTSVPTFQTDYLQDPMQEGLLYNRIRDGPQHIESIDALDGRENRVNSSNFCHEKKSDMARAADQLNMRDQEGQNLQRQLVFAPIQHQDEAHEYSDSTKADVPVDDRGTMEMVPRGPQPCSASITYRAALKVKAAGEAAAKFTTSEEKPKQQRKVESKQENRRLYDGFFKDMPQAEIGWRLPEPLDQLNFTLVEILVLLPKLYQNFAVGVRFQSNGITNELHHFITCRHKNDDAKGLIKDGICHNEFDEGLDWGKIIDRDQSVFLVNTILAGYRGSLRKRGRNKWHDKYGHDDKKRWAKWSRTKHAAGYKLSDWDEKHAHEISMRYYYTSAGDAGKMPFKQLTKSINVLPYGSDAGDLTKALRYVLEHPEDENGKVWEFPIDLHRILDKCGRTIITEEHRDPAAIKRWLGIMESIGAHKMYEEEKKRKKRKRDDVSGSVLSSSDQSRQLANWSPSTESDLESDNEQQSDSEPSAKRTKYLAKGPESDSASSDGTEPSLLQDRGEQLEEYNNIHRHRSNEMSPMFDETEPFEEDAVDCYCYPSSEGSLQEYLEHHDEASSADADQVNAVSDEPLPRPVACMFGDGGEDAEFDEMPFNQVLELASSHHPFADVMHPGSMPGEDQTQYRENEKLDRLESSGFTNNSYGGRSLDDILQMTDEPPNDKKERLRNELEFTHKPHMGIDGLEYLLSDQQRAVDRHSPSHLSFEEAHRGIETQDSPGNSGALSSCFEGPAAPAYPIADIQHQIGKQVRPPHASLEKECQKIYNYGAYPCYDYSRLSSSDSGTPDHLPTESWKADFDGEFAPGHAWHTGQFAEDYSLSFTL